MNWAPETVIEDFRAVAKLAGIAVEPRNIEIETLPAPHVPPTRLPPGKMAVYVFSRNDTCLKVGKVGPKSQARYTSQHYNPGSAMSTLAGSILADRKAGVLTDITESNVGDWIKEHVDRVNILLDMRLGVHVLTLLEAFLQCRLQPKYEGFRNQKK